VLTEQAILTALPAGVDRDRGVARLSCFVTLRATGEAATLHATRFFADWPQALSGALPDLEVEIAGTGRVPSAVVSPAPESGLWRAIFAPGTPVEPHEPERWTQRPVATYAARAVHAYVVDLLARTAAGSPTTPPRSIDMLAGLDDASRAWAGLLDIPSASQLLGDGLVDTAAREHNAGLFEEPMSARLDGAVAGRLAESAAAAADRYDRETGRRIRVDGAYLPATAPIAGSSLQAELARFLVFHHRPEVPPTPLPDAAQLARDLDFERIQTALGGYGFLLRRLGLVIDLELPLDAVRPDESRIRIVPPPADLPERRLPWTAYRLPGPDGSPAFWPAPRPEPVGERVADGLLDLGFGERYSLAQVDVDSAAFKTLNAALATTARALLPRPVGSPDTDAAPALRSTGLAVLHDRRAEALHGKLASGHNMLVGLAAGDPPTLYAEDVTRGYRIDVTQRRHAGSWHSLHARRGHYITVGQAAGALAEDVDDEGFTQLALGQQAQPPGAAADPTAPVYLHESLARWEGWSLSAPRPGLALSRSPHAPTPGDPDSQPVPDRNDALPDGVPLEVTFHVQPGSLPRLRVGGEYQVRARAVDLAGNGPTIAEADALLGAFDAAGVPQPVLPQRRPFEFRRFDPLAAPAVVPRRADTEGESVEHAVLRSDHDVSAPDYAADTGYAATTERHVAPAKAALQDAELLGCFDAAIGSGDPGAVQAAYTVALRESGRLGEVGGGEVVRPEEQLELPYLPDPWSVGTALVGLPGLAAGTVTRVQPDGTMASEPDQLPGQPPQPGVLLVDWGTPQSWWQARPFRLLVVEGSGPPAWDAATRVLTVALPKAARVDVQVSSLPDEQHLDEHGAWRALLDVAAAQDVPALRQLARTGRLWAVSPARTVRLVHALQHPLHVPDVLVLGATRLRSSTSAILAGEIRIHAASTDRVDVAASWQEWADEPRPGGDDAPSRRERTAVALTQQVHLRRDVASEPPAGDRAQAARFTEADDLLVLGAGPRSGDVPEFLSAHELHDTKHRRIAYRAVATSRFREYFRPDLVTPPQALTRESEPVWVDVPSSAPPPPPQLLYAVPLFGWERGGEGRTRTTRRRGGGLRLFLSRQWHASGDGELLGAVLWPGSASCPVPAALDRLVTRWGFDPVWPAAPPPPTPGAQHFTRGVAVGEDLPLLEDPAQRVSVVGHEVEFDAARDLWTCDVELDLGEAYTPFVRLALARYQPSSIAGAHLSAVTTAQIVQVTPERTVSLTAASDDPLLLSLAVTGPAHGAAWQTGGVPFPYGSDVEVSVEERDDAIADPDIGWRRVDQPAVLDHGPPTRGALVRYSGRVRLPDGHVPGRHRVVVVERERLAADPEPFWAPAGAAARPTSTRVVFAETFVI
jgi:hypothetical protein